MAVPMFDMMLAVHIAVNAARLKAPQRPGGGSADAAEDSKSMLNPVSAGSAPSMNLIWMPSATSLCQIVAPHRRRDAEATFGRMISIYGEADARRENF
jgi:hypothetical protein